MYSFLLNIALFSQAQPPLYADKANLLVVIDAAGKPQPIKDAAAWEKRRAHILAGMEEAMGPLPKPAPNLPLDLKVDEEVRLEKDKLIRQRISFQVADGERVRAFLFLPAEKGQPIPAILCLHQTNGKLGAEEPAGLGGLPNLHYALELARRGYVTLAPDYPSFGTYQFNFAKSPFVSGTMKAIWNNTRAIDLLQSLPTVHKDKIGCIGHSLGGHNTLFTAAFDRRIVALVSSCGYNSFPKYYGGKIKGWTSDRYMPRLATKYDLDVKKVPFDFPEILAAIAPRAFLSCSPVGDGNFEVSGVKDCIAAARPVYELLGAKDRLEAAYPDAGHDFPQKTREQAYAWFDRWLK